MPTEPNNKTATTTEEEEPQLGGGHQNRVEMKITNVQAKLPNHYEYSSASSVIKFRLAIVQLVVLLSIVENLLPIKMVKCNSVDYCYSDIGCFPLSDEFYHPRHRPFNVRPWHRRHIRTEFELFSARFPDGIKIKPWDRLSLIAAQFNPKLETKVIIPGWLDNVDRAVWVKHLRDALLWMWTPINLIIVRWRNFTPYTVATANTRVVGAELANLIKFIEHELGYHRSYYHLIGHSLGAHIGGYCGDRVPGLGRITALDPARPFFQGMPKSVRLDRGDAKFIDAIHSDFTPENAIFLLMSFGMTTPVGHVDFYPNGPPLLQPGCLRDTIGAIQRGILRGLQYSSFQVTFVEALRYLTACDHQRSHEWFIESITNRECVFVGVRCNDYEGMINGRCTCDDSQSACAIMGIHADQMYLNNAHEDLWPLGSRSSKTKQQLSAAKKPPHRQPHKPSPPFDFGPPPPVPLMANPNPALLDELDYLNVQAPTRDAILAQLRQEMSQMRRPVEPAPPSDYLMPMMIEPSNVIPQVVDSPMADQQQQQQLDAALIVERLRLEALDRQQQQLDQEQEQLYQDTLNDLAFVEYLRAAILDQQFGGLRKNQSDTLDFNYSTDTAGSSSTNTTTNRSNRDVEYDDDGRNSTATAGDNKLQEEQGGDDDGNNSVRRQDFPYQNHHHHHPFHDEQLLPPHIHGHPKLMSDHERDVENWYEESSRWHLKTNHRPNYCSNQYQVLVFIGPLKSRTGRGGRLRANLIVSIIGSRGQLLNQRFVPRSASLDSFTMQPFFILLEGSYSLGQIKSVAIAWEQRHDPDPIKATISFQNNKLADLQMKVPAFKLKHPWLSETIKYDHTEGFQWNPKMGNKYPDRRSQSSSSPNSNSLGRRKSGPALDGSASSRGTPKTRRPRSTRIKQTETGGDKCRRSTTETKQQTCSSDTLTRRSQESLDYADDYDDLPASPSLSYASNRLLPPAASEADEDVPSFLDPIGGAALSLATGALLDASLISPVPIVPFASGGLAGVMQPTSPMDERESTFFEPLVETLLDPNLLVDKIKAIEDDKRMTIELHNLQHLQKHAMAAAAGSIDLDDDDDEDSIIVNQIVVSPMQASYGQTGLLNAKAFCSPRRGLKLRRDQTVRLRPSITSRCYEGQVLHAGR